jgi:hypothetical protein
MPVSYPVKDLGTTHELAYHPFLPLVASPGTDSVAVINCESGKVEADRVTLDADVLAGGRIERLLFSPDGTTVSVPRSRLSPADQQWLDSPAGQQAVSKLKSGR